MPTQNTKKIGQHPADEPVSNKATVHHTWTVMRPFVHFSVKAMRVISHTLIFIVKSIPKPHDHKERNKDDRVIKI